MVAVPFINQSMTYMYTLEDVCCPFWHRPACSGSVIACRDGGRGPIFSLIRCKGLLLGLGSAPCGGCSAAIFLFRLSATCSIELAFVTLAVGLLAPIVVGASVSVRSCSVGSATNWSFRCDGLWFLCTILLVILVLSVPNAAGLAGRIYELERFHHWDFFVMGPALQFRHGRALGSEGYAQYGIGFPLLVEGLSRFIPLRYDNLLRIGINLGCIYFTALASS